MNAIMTVCTDCFAAIGARLDAARNASVAETLPPAQPTEVEIKEAQGKVADTLYRYGNVLPEIPVAIINAAIECIEPPAGYPRRAKCKVDVPGLGHVEVELTCHRRPKPRPPDGKATRYEFFWFAARAQRG